MNWLSDHWLDLLGWGGSSLLIFSLLQARVFRFRILNLTASLVLLAFNAMLGVWPMVGMNLVLACINTFFILRLIRQRHDEAVFEVLEVNATDAYLRHVLRVHEEDIHAFQPDFVADDAARPDRHAFLVQRGDETVGVVLLVGDGETARVELDYVTPRFRDFSPGEFVWRRSGLLKKLGFRKVLTPANMVGAYYARLGFRRQGPSYLLEL